MEEEVSSQAREEEFFAGLICHDSTQSNSVIACFNCGAVLVALVSRR